MNQTKPDEIKSDQMYVEQKESGNPTSTDRGTTYKATQKSFTTKLKDLISRCIDDYIDEKDESMYKQGREIKSIPYELNRVSIRSRILFPVFYYMPSIVAVVVVIVVVVVVVVRDGNRRAVTTSQK